MNGRFVLINASPTQFKNGLGVVVARWIHYQHRATRRLSARIIQGANDQTCRSQHMRVDHRGLQTAMTQQQLNSSYVRTRSEQMGGERGCLSRLAMRQFLYMWIMLFDT